MMSMMMETMMVVVVVVVVALVTVDHCRHYCRRRHGDVASFVLSSKNTLKKEHIFGHASRLKLA